MNSVMHRLTIFFTLACLALAAQSLMPGSGPGGVVRIINSDAAVLESQEVHKDLPCTISAIRPVLGFDLRFHAGYEVLIPLRELAGADDSLTTVFRVTRAGHPDGAVYFSHHVNVPGIEPDSKGNADLHGSFDVGEGSYHVDLLMRDRGERVCSFYWDLEAALPQRDKRLRLMIAPGAVESAELQLFKQEPRITREPGGKPLNVKVIINFAPQKYYSATLQPLDMNALVSILRSIAREPRIHKVSVVAVNVQEQRVIYRQEETDQVDFPALGEALNSLTLATVDFKRLSQRRRESDFLASLITEEMGGGQHPDAVIFAGPKVMVEGAVPEESLKSLGEIRYPVFYMNYNLDPKSLPWRDAIGTVVKYLRGYEYTISRPRDLWYAWTEIMSKILKFRSSRPTIPSSP